MSWTWKSDQIWRRLVHFFRSNAELNSSFTRQFYRWTTDTGLEGVAGHLFKLLQIREVPWNDCRSHMAIQEQSWRPKESPEAAKLSLFDFQLGAGFVIETWPRPCKKAMRWYQEVKLNWLV